jgi:hypothetical protein
MQASSVVEMSVEDRIWLACAIDCEGSIVPGCVAVYNTCQEFLETCVAVTGVGKIYPVSRYRSKNNLGVKEVYSWQVQSVNNIIALLRQLRPYFIIKREKVIELLWSWDMQEGGVSCRHPA